MPSRPGFRILADPHHLSSKPSSHKVLVLPVTVGGIVLVAVILLLFIVWYHRNLKLSSTRTSPDDALAFKLHKFPYRELKRATNRFSESRKLGKGGFGVVYRGVLRDGKEVAVKKMELSSLQGEREFQNELSINGSLKSPYVVSLLGYCTRGKKVRLLVYECMQNRSLQEALFEKSYPVPLDWDKRFKIIVDIAKALSFLHLECNPPIIHGDVKPSNILLDRDFSARIADFGLARFKTEDLWTGSGRHSMLMDRMRTETPDRSRHGTPEGLRPYKPDRIQTETSDGDGRWTPRKLHTESTEKGTGQVTIEEQNMSVQSLDKQFANKDSSVSLDISSPSAPQGFHSELVATSETGISFRPSPADVTNTTEPGLSPRSDGITTEGDEWGRAYPSEGNTTDEITVVDRSREQQHVMQKTSGKDWWWKQESGELSVKDYVMEWIGNELQSSGQSRTFKDEHQKGEFDRKLGNVMQAKDKGKEGSSRRSTLFSEMEKKRERKKGKVRKSREWWKDEYFAELNKKRKEGKKRSCGNSVLESFSGDLSGYSGELKRLDTKQQERRKGSCRLKDWKGYHSGEFSFRKDWWNYRNRPEGTDRVYWSGDILNKQSVGNISNRQCSGELVNKSGELVSRDVSSTTSMRGTVCYVPPEYGGCGILSDKGDIYSFGVLILVIVSGRRPIQVTASPMKEFERANLISWARNLSQNGSILDLVDQRLQGNYDRDQATLCITLALLCLQRLPAARPSITDIVKILTGEAPSPSCPLEFSPSPPSKCSFKSPVQPVSECATN